MKKGFMTIRSSKESSGKIKIAISSNSEERGKEGSLGLSMSENG